MVKIRLRRMGSKKNPFYRIVVADSRYPRNGRFIEEIGTYDPLQEPSAVKVDAERAQAWIKTGAQPTETVKALLKKANASLGVVGVCGALAHNAAQLCAAYFLTSTSVLFYVPFLLVFGVLTGLLTGLVLKLTLKPLERLQKYLGP